MLIYQRVSGNHVCFHEIYLFSWSIFPQAIQCGKLATNQWKWTEYWWWYMGYSSLCWVTSGFLDRKRAGKSPQEISAENDLERVDSPYRTRSFQVGISKSNTRITDHCYTGWWWLEHDFCFPYIGNNHPSWLIFCRGVETTNPCISGWVIMTIDDGEFQGNHPHLWPNCSG